MTMCPPRSKMQNTTGTAFPLEVSGDSMLRITQQLFAMKSKEVSLCHLITLVRVGYESIAKTRANTAKQSRFFQKQKVQRSKEKSSAEIIVI